MIDDVLGGQGLQKRPLNMFFLLDCSSSMAGEKIASLNQFMREALVLLKGIHDDVSTPGALHMNTIAFSSSAWWQGAVSTPVDKLGDWLDMPANGVTDLGAALALLDGALTEATLTLRLFPPVLVLVSDGQPTDNWSTRLAKLKSNPYWKHSIRLAIAIGPDAADGPLAAFIDHKEIPILRADNHDQLKKFITWISTRVTATATSGKTDVGSTDNTPQDQIAKQDKPDQDIFMNDRTITKW